uniref:Serine aminopeptidase S33 domain-containing protein n=1 Tax=viral metagenome TaxID=1070528 RepID=A0A6C0LRQ3_9ZZZZ
MNIDSLYKKIIYVTIFIAILIMIMVYLKNILLYHPTKFSKKKYDIFYQRLFNLTGSSNFIINLEIVTSDGILLDTIYIKNPNVDSCIIFFHGNAGNISMRFDMIKFLYNYSSVLIFDYRSYGKSSGNSVTLTCDKLLIDSRTILEYTIHTLKFKPSKISLFGESLGCSIAIFLAAELSKTLDSKNYLHAIILNSPFYSLESIIESVFDKIGIGFWGKLFSVIYGREYKSNEWIQLINHQTKIMIAHSLRDEVIPYQESNRLYKLIHSIHPNVKFITITGTHNDVGLTEEYIYLLSDLIE